MGYLTGRETFDQVVEKMRHAIEYDRNQGHEMTRLAAVGEAILREHTPEIRKIGEKCPKCEGERFPCTIMRSFIIDPD